MDSPQCHLGAVITSLVLGTLPPPPPGFFISPKVMLWHFLSLLCSQVPFFLLADPQGGFLVQYDMSSLLRQVESADEGE